MKIFMFSSVHRWDDTRVLHREAVSLAEEHDIELHIPAPFAEREMNGVRIMGLPQWALVRDRGAIRKELRRRIAVSDADVYHFHDPELIPTGLWIQRHKHKPVIYDVHEDYSAYIRSKEWIPRLLRLPVAAFFRRYEQYAVRRLDRMIAATPAIARVLGHGERVIEVHNYPRLDVSGQLPEKASGPLQLVYVGSMEEIRGLGNLCQAFQKACDHLGDSAPELHVVGKLMGSTEYQQKLEHCFAHERVHYHGFLPFTEAQQIMNHADVGIVPFLPEPNHLEALPNKFFEYMNAGLMLLVSDFPLWQSLLSQHGLGWTFNPLDPQHLAQQIIRAVVERVQVQRCGVSGFQAVREHFNWSIEEQKLKQVYARINS